MTKPSDAVYIISVAAEIVGMHPQTLRVYERKGLVDPYRTPGGTRRYSQVDLDRLIRIQELSSAGVNLAGIKQIMALQIANDRLTNQVSRLRRLLENAETRRDGHGTSVVRVRATRKRQLPAIRRSSP
jgi:MerR family transcriptional regulator/heat shock protein HspR